jgi:hypothetical protein
MKKLIYVFLLIGLSACEFYYLEPRNHERDRILGQYEVQEYSETYNLYTYYSIWIEPTNRYDEVYIDNFYGASIGVYATVSNGKITIYRQTVDGYEIEGVGTVYGNEISMNYRVKDRYTNSRADFCETTAWQEW